MGKEDSGKVGVGESRVERFGLGKRGFERGKVARGEMRLADDGDERGGGRNEGSWRPREAAKRG